MNLSFGQAPWLLILLLLLAVVASWWTYRSTVPDLRPLHRWFLGSLRALSLGLILFLLFEPVWQRHTENEVEPVVAVLIDGSESMSLADSLLSEAASPVIDKIQSIQESLRGVDVRYFSFGSGIQELDSLGRPRFTASRTDIAGALNEVNNRLNGVPLSSVILLSDGLYNSGTNPVHTAERFSVPIFTIAHGDSTTRRDVRIVQVVTNELTFVGSDVPVLVRVRNDGYTASSLLVQLSSSTGILDRQTIQLPPSGTESEVELSFKADLAGRQSLAVTIGRFPEEVTYRNNAHTVSVLVLDQKKRVALLSGAPSPDASSLVRQLESDDTVELTTLVQAPNGSFYNQELPPDLGDYDLIVSVGFPGKSTPAAVSASVAGAVREGVSLLFVLDRDTDLGALRRDFNTLLPVTLGTVRPAFILGSMLTTPAADAHAIFNTGERPDNAQWNRLPPIFINESRWEASPSASVLATTQVRGIALPDPLFVVGRMGQTKSAALLGHGFWKWTNVPEDLEAPSAVFKAALENTFQWLYASDDNRLVRVQPSETDYAEGEPVILTGEVYDETLRPLSDASLSIQLTAPDGQLFPFEMAAVGNGRYSLDVGSLPSGSYTYSAIAARNEGEIGTDSGSFSIGARTLEFQNTKADFALMSQIAARSGGQAVEEQQIRDLGDMIRGLPGFRPVTSDVVTQSRLWQMLPFLILILTLLTVEWFFRKRFGMV